MRFLVFPILIFWYSGLSAQTDIDSLKYALPGLQGSAKAEVLSELVDLLKKEQPDEALHYASTLKNLVKDGSRNEQFKVNQQIARAWFNLGVFDSSKFYHKQNLALARELDDPDLITASFVNLSEDQRMLGNADEAMNYLLQAKKFAEKTDNRSQLSSVYNNIGISFKSMEKYDDALKYYRKSLKITENLADSIERLSSSAITFHNMGLVFADKDNLDSAKHFYQKALRIRRQINDKRGMVSTLNNMAQIYSREGNNEKAKEVFLELIPETQAINDGYGTALACHNLGNVYLALDEKDSAEFFLKKTLELNKNTGANYLQQMTHQRLSEIYEEAGYYKQALLHHQVAVRIKDSISGIQRMKQLNELQARFDAEQKSKDLNIASRKAEVAVLQRNLLIGGSIALFLIAALIIYLLKMRVKKNRELARQAELRRKKEQEISELKLENNLLERERLLNELDNRTRQLTSSSLHIIQNKQILEEVREQLDEMRSDSDTGTRSKLSKISKLIEYGKTLEDDWQQFQGYFDSLHQSFFENLKKEHDELTTNDLRLCALIRLNFSVKEAASILNITHGSMKTARYRLRKKLDLQEGEDLYAALMKY